MWSDDDYASGADDDCVRTTYADDGDDDDDGSSSLAKPCRPKQRRITTLNKKHVGSVDDTAQLLD